MTPDPGCVVCGEKQWETIAAKRYSADNQYSREYSSIRKDILFNIWFASPREIKLNTLICKVCGFVCYSPRPDHQDIESKYRYLAEHASASLEFSESRKSDHRRSCELYEYIRSYMPHGANRILDYGGGNGRLLKTFLENRFHCSIVELVNEVMPGIEYIGPSISEIPEDRKFDVAITSHVLEHLVDPLQALRGLKSVMADRGLIYVEV
tara:strand:+ start:31478 stop:32104 length:627 start_codon:yes stop_codon:yes gene_type:complete